MIEKLNKNNRNEFDRILHDSTFSISNSTFSKIFLFKLDNKVVAFINYSLIYERAELDYIYVNKNCRKVGIATKLMNYFIDDTIKNNVDSITLEVRCSNTSAINLYKKFKFKKINIRNNYYSDGENALLMIRKFDKNENNIHIRN